MRKTSEELNKIKKKLNVNDLYSWSRYNCYKQDKYSYYLKYIKKVKEDRHDGIYSVSGGICHDILEKFYSKEIQYEDMINEYENELMNMNLAELKYNRSDDEKNEKIANKYEDCIRHFFKNHIPITKKVEIERFITVRIGDYVFQGYIDFMYKDDGYYYVVDWKTSTIYTGEKIIKEAGQLILYSEALRQLGVPLDKIKARWCFLKYVTVEMIQANSKVRISNIARNEIGSKLASNIKMWMKKAGYEEQDIDNYINMVSEFNDITYLPDDIKAKYKIMDCYVDVPLSEEIIDGLKSNIIEILQEIEAKELEYKKTQDEMIWWEDVTDKSSYYFANLCGYSAFIHKPYAKYLDSLNMFKNEEDGVGEDFSWMENI